MISCNALVPASAKRVEVISVQCADNTGHILSVVVDCARDLMRRGNSCDFQLRCRNHETLVNKDICSYRMIDDHETKMVIIVSLPEFSRDPQIVVTIMWDELIAPDLVPFFSCLDARCSK